MNVQITTQAIHNISCDALVVAAARKGVGQEVLLTKTANSVDELLNGIIHERCQDGEFKGNLGEILTIHPMGKLAAKRIIVVGLGDQQKIDAQMVQRASASV